MRVYKYIPDKLYGFARDEEGEVFFHLGGFQPGGPWMMHLRCKSCPKEGCTWATTAPAPILGEAVEVVVEEGAPSRGPSPRAISVKRLIAPIPLQGTVEALDTQRGFGFIKVDDGTSYHLHRCELLDGRIPRVGQRVMFYAGVRKKRPRACHVKVCPNE